MSGEAAHDPESTLRAYVKAFETLDPSAVAAFYHLPSTFVAAFGVAVVPDAESARGMASRLVEHARGQGYRRTETLDLEVKRLADRLASLHGVFVRFDDTGAEIGRFGFTYVLRDDGTSWKIAVAVAHDAAPARS